MLAASMTHKREVDRTKEARGRAVLRQVCPTFKKTGSRDYSRASTKLYCFSAVLEVFEQF
jgi:hypothetical protein